MCSYIQENDHVILQQENFHCIVKVVKQKLQRVKNFKVFLDNLIDLPFESYVAVESQYLVQANQPSFDFSSDMVDINEDNRNLVGSSDNQSLKAEQIKELKSQGVSGEKLIDELKLGSASFNSKTTFSQIKYVKKKAKRHAPIFIVHRVTSHSLCDLYLDTNPHKILGIRNDTIANLISRANIYAASNVLILENCSGILLKAVLEAFDPNLNIGNVISLHHTTQAPNDVVSYLLPGYSNKLLNISLLEVIPLLLKGLPIRSFQEFCHRLSKFNRQTEINSELEPPTKKTKNYSYILENIANTFPEICLFKDFNILDEVNGEKAMNLAENFLKVAPKLKKIVDILAAENGADSLIIASKFYPIEITLLLLQFIAPGRPFVIYSETLQLLLETHEAIKQMNFLFLNSNQDERGIFGESMEITDFWFRKYQILPERTHPEVNMSATGGYILAGYSFAQVKPTSEIRRKACLNLLKSPLIKSADLKNNLDLHSNNDL